MKIPEEQIRLTQVVPAELAGLRLDKAMSKLFSDYSRERLQRWIQQEWVKLNGKHPSQREKVHTGDLIEIYAELEREIPWTGEPIALNIIYEDDTLLIINKPVGLVVHPAAGHYTGTLVNALLHHAPELAQLPRSGIIHRLDKDTSGLLVVAKTLTAHTELVRQLQQRSIKREYVTIVTGNLISGGTVDAPIGRHPIHRKRMAVIESGKEAITHYRIIERFPSHTYLRVFLETGRTHQIRVHMAHIQHAIVGDATYGGRLKIPPQASSELIDYLHKFKRQALHAYRLGLIHPKTKEYCEWEAPLPEDMQQLLQILQNS